MKRIAKLLSLMLAFAALSGMNCQGTTTSQPAGDPGNGTPNDPELFIASIGADGKKDQLIVNGTFGAQQGTVMINGTTLSVVSWGPAATINQQIICDLPREAFGNVQVQVGTRFSNIAQLTKWELALVSKTRIPASPPSSGEHNIEFTNKFIIRSCLNNLLGATGNFGSFASVSRASTGDLNAFGTITNPASGGNPAQDITLSRLPLTFNIVYPGDMVDPATDRFSATNFVCGATRGSGGGIKLLYSVAGFYQVTDSIGNPPVGEHGTGYATNTYFDTSQPVLFFFDGDFNIVSGSVTAKNDPNSTLEWQEATAQSPPLS